MAVHIDPPETLEDFPPSWSLLTASLIMLVVGDIVQASMSALDVNDAFRYIVIGSVGLMVITSAGVIAGRTYFWVLNNIAKNKVLYKRNND